MSGDKRQGRNRGRFTKRHGLPTGCGALEECLLAIADAQATLDMDDRALERACGLRYGTLGKLRAGTVNTYALRRITEFLETRLETAAA